ncbi:MAG: sulfur carrier protein ThiS [Gammaproteobacteria bacterium]|nr:sulfur carrier protein ThiS [Gammaproteobacteria bacterium]NNJ85480.1 sulfur carrier protein ThiS [Gammaproteobacteria bacterium]
MNIILNGKACELAGQISITRLLEIQEIAGKRVAVEVNEEIVPRSKHDRHELREGDRVEIVRAIGGG